MILNILLIFILSILIRFSLKTKRILWRFLALITSLAIVLFLGIYLFARNNPNYFSSSIWQKYQCLNQSMQAYSFKETFFTAENVKIPHELKCNYPNEITINLNKFGYRNFSRSAKELKDIKIAIFGDNYSLGLGLQDHETLSTHLALAFPDSIIDLSQPGMSPTYFLKLSGIIYRKKLAPNLETLVYNFRDSHFARDAGNGKWKFIKENKKKTVNIDQQSIVKNFFHPIFIVNNFIKDFQTFLQPLEASEEEVFQTAEALNRVHALCQKGLCKKLMIVLWPIENEHQSLRQSKLLPALNPEIQIINAKELKFNYLDQDKHITAESTKNLADFLLKNWKLEK